MLINKKMDKKTLILKKLNMLSEPVILPIKYKDGDSRSIVLTITKANYTNDRHSSAIVTMVSTPLYFSNLLHWAYFSSENLIKKVYKRSSVVIIFSFNSKTKIHETCGPLTLITINYSDYEKFLYYYTIITKENQVRAEDIIVIFDKLPWSHVYHLLNKIGLRASGGSHTKRHLLSLSHYRLVEFLKSTCTLHELIEFKHNYISPRLAQTLSDKSSEYTSIVAILKNSFYNIEIQKDKLLNKKYRLFTEINKFLREELEKDNPALGTALFDNKLDSLTIFYDALNIEISEQGLKIQVSDEFIKKYEEVIKEKKVKPNK